MPRALRGTAEIRIALVTAAILASGACATVRPMTGPSTLWHPTSADTVPAGTLLSAQTRQPLSTADSHVGDRFTAELLDPLVGGTGQQLLPRGTLVTGVVKNATRSNGLGSRPTLELQVVGLEPRGEPMVSAPLEFAESPGELTSVTGRTIVGGLAGAAVGAGAGLGINHNQAGVVVGSTFIGLGLGAVAAYFFGPRDAVVPAGSILTLRVMRDLTWTKSIATNQTSKDTAEKTSVQP
jgi:hypothetical protein